MKSVFYLQAIFIKTFSTGIFGVTIGTTLVVAPITAKLVRIGAQKQKRHAGAATRMPTDHLECLYFGHVARGAEAPSHADQGGRTWQRAAFSRLAQGS